MVEILKAYGPWLLVGVVMYFMMRRGGCCGGHAGHNEGGHDHKEDLGKDTAAKKKSCH